MTGRHQRASGTHPRFLVLAHEGDVGAVRVAAALEQRHAGHATLVSDVALAGANWTHRQGTDGTESRVALGDGRTLTHDGFSLVFNRLHGVFPHRFAVADEADRQYAQAETNALLLSWLASFACPVVPAPAPPALSAVLPSLPGLLALASRAGLPARRFAFSSNARLAPTDDLHLAFPGDVPPPATGPTVDPTPRYHLGRDPALYLEAVAGTPRRLLVVGDDVLGPVPDGLGPACIRFATETGCPVLGLRLDRREASGTAPADRWCLCGADSHPALATWEDAVTVADHLASRATRHRTERRPLQRSDG